ncbi:hypothetical protein MNBD_GAMMA24-1079 [hydrothermal vent metagenome]|uniref:Phage-related protein n=1 Tax=hydrothermal vent metagenome TaxID=652676 RepID=A0A3B1C4W0_9ZZZZ
MTKGIKKTLEVVFYKHVNGGEPVKEWLLSLPRADRKTIGTDIKTAEFGWPVGMPLIRKLEPKLWEVRTDLDKRIARVLFTIKGKHMVLLHGFIKKSQNTPSDDKKLARNRMKKL